MFYNAIRPVLFKLDAETSHNITLSTLATVSRSKVLTAALRAFCSPQIHKPVDIMGITFPNAVGLAAGLDKHGRACNAFHAMGFGWVELGTVTPLPQPGNPRPRLFRLPEKHAIINRFGFNSVGLEEFIKNIKRANPNIIKGINIGKNAATSLGKAEQDYVIALREVCIYADYVAINISSPNTKNLRDLQQDDALDSLLCTLNLQRQKLVDQHGRAIPLVVKISPDIDENQIATIAKLLRKHKMDGVAASNTTISRKEVQNHQFGNEVGGLSGPPVRELSTNVIHKLNYHLQGEIPIIGIGGIDDVQSAEEKFSAGASLVQLYSGFIYKGPGLIQDILKNRP